MIVAIHQPQYLPWLGFFDKLARCDVFCLLDTVQFCRLDFQNRNRIRTATGWQWLTVPVDRSTLFHPIQDVRIRNQQPWRQATWRSIEQNYRRAPYWNTYSPYLEYVYRQDWDSLAELDLTLIVWMAQQFNLEHKVIRASTSKLIEITSKKGDLVLDILRHLGADAYQCGRLGSGYLDYRQFAAAGIAVLVHDFAGQHPVYQQRYVPFVPCMSAIDALFNLGPGSRDLLGR